MVMKKGKCLIFGLLPLTAAAALPNVSMQKNGNVSKSTKVENISDIFAIGEEGTVDQLILKNASPQEVVGMLEQLTKCTALMEQKLPAAQISLEIHEPISKKEAIAALESVLSLNGIAIVNMGGTFMKVVTSKSAITQSPDILDESLLTYEPTQKVYSKFFKFRYLDATEFQKLIKPLLTPSSSNTVLFASSNSLFITDTMANLQTIENLVQRTDTPINMVESINFLPLNNVKASAVSKKFEALKRGGLKKYLNNMTIDYDDSSNQLIVITSQENLPVIVDIVKQLDNKCELLLRSEVIRVKHGDAKKITDIVSGIVKEQRSRVEKENKMAFERQQAQMSAQSSLASALAQAASGSRSNQQISNTYSDFISSQQLPGGELGEEQAAQFSANLTLSSDERSNSIIVYGTASDLSQVRHLIANLDVLLDQVRIEVIVAQITLNEGQQSGMDALDLGYHQGEAYNQYKGSKKIAQIDAGQDGGDKTLTHEYQPREYDINFKGSLGPDGGLGSFAGTLKNFALSTVFKKAKMDSNIKILSTPTLVTTHNRKANFKIGEERPFIDSSTQKDDKDSKERISLIYKHVGLELTVTPLIGSNGIIQMEIEQKISKYDGDVSAGSVLAPIISDKQIDSFVSVANGDVIVIAGFKEKEESKSGGKLFILGDIPVLGDALFTSRKRDEKTKELIVFIKPTIILHPQEESAYLDKRLEVTNFKEDIAHYKATGDFPKSKPFPKDTIFGLNAQAMAESAQARKKGEGKAAKINQNRATRRNRRRGKSEATVQPVPTEPEPFVAAESSSDVWDGWAQREKSETEKNKRNRATRRNRRRGKSKVTVQPVPTEPEPFVAAESSSDVWDEWAQRERSEAEKNKQNRATRRDRRRGRSKATVQPVSTEPEPFVAAELPSDVWDEWARQPITPGSDDFVAEVSTKEEVFPDGISDLTPESETIFESKEGGIAKPLTRKGHFSRRR
jgi:general secretion pathway protein D